MGGIPADLQDPVSTGPLSGGSSDSVLSTPTSMFSESSSSATPSSTDATESTTSDQTESTQVSARDQECYFHTAYDADDDKAFLQPVRKPRPVISVQTFTPLIGSLLMSHSSLVCEAAKAAIIGILARLRNTQLPSYEPWPERHIEVGQSKTYYAQTGVHIHDYIALTPEEKKIIQDELLNAIVVGMAKLDETQSPYNPELDENQYVQGDGSPYGYFDDEFDAEGAPTAINGFDEAFGAFGEDGEQRQGTSPELANVPAVPVESDRPDATGETPVENDDEAPPVPHPEIVVPQVAPEPVTPALLSPSTAPGNPALAPGVGDDPPSEDELFPETDFDSPNAPPVDHRSYSEVAAYEGENDQRTDPPPEFDQQYTEELSVEASHGRLLSMNLIAAVVECGVLAEEDVATRLFVPEVVRMRFDESYAVRREAALAMAELLKVVSQDVVMDSLVRPAASPPPRPRPTRLLCD
jgi:serine/threonine-protein phosphatase 4 regulatory subunit 1